MSTEFFPLGVIAPNPFQPRQTIDPAGVAELAANILATRAAAPESFGLLQLPRARRHGPGIQLAYGHRRLEAFRLLAGQGHTDYQQFPVELVTLSDADMAITAWSENAVRQDINPMEEARFVRRLIDEFGWTIKTTAQALGVPFGTLSNTIRLTTLPNDIQDMVAAGQIATARALGLVALVDQVGEDELRRLALTAGKASHRAFQQQINHARRTTATGVDLVATVIEPAAHVLTNALAADEPGAWLVVARAIDPKAADVDSPAGLALLVIEKMALRAPSTRDARKRVNQSFGDAGLETPWNEAAMAKVSQFLAWQKKKRARAASDGARAA